MTAKNQLNFIFQLKLKYHTPTQKEVCVGVAIQAGDKVIFDQDELEKSGYLRARQTLEDLTAGKIFTVKEVCEETGMATLKEFPCRLLSLGILKKAP